MPEPRIHHWVPKLYLRSFSDRGNQERIYAINKQSGEVIPTNPRNVAAKRDLYTTTKPSGKKDSTTLESNLSKLESIAAPALRRILQSEPFDEEVQIGLATLVALQMTRSPQMRDKASRMLGDMYKQSTKIIAGHRDYFHRKYNEMLEETGLETKLSAEEVRQWAMEGRYDVTVDDEYSMASSLRMLEHVTRIFYRMSWSILQPRNRSRYFVTCDNPYGLMNPDLFAREFRPVGLINKDTTIHFPLSPQMYALGNWHGKDGYHEVPTDYVREMNVFAVLRSDRFVFSHLADEAMARFVHRTHERATELRTSSVE